MNRFRNTIRNSDILPVIENSKPSNSPSALKNTISNCNKNNHIQLEAERLISHFFFFCGTHLPAKSTLKCNPQLLPPGDIIYTWVNSSLKKYENK
jgi:hypothetical protein